MVRRRAAVLVVVGVPALAATLLVGSSHALAPAGFSGGKHTTTRTGKPELTVGISEAALCADERVGSTLVDENASRGLSPPEGATELVGSPVTFSGYPGSGSTLTFAVASSPAGISNPDIDNGAASAQPGGSYVFTSTKATATPRTVYWAATFTNPIAGCTDLPTVTYTTSVHTLVVEAPPPIPTPTAVTMSGGPAVVGRGVALRLSCQAPAGGECRGNATLTATEPVAGRRVIAARAPGHVTAHPKTVTVGEAPFELQPGASGAVTVVLDDLGHVLLGQFSHLLVTLGVHLDTTAGMASPVTVTERGVTIPALNTRRVARSIASSIYRVKHFRARVQCPTGVIEVKGNDFTCYATGTVEANGHRVPYETPFTIEQTNSRGYIDYRSG